MNEDTLDEAERQLIDQLTYLQQQYQRASEPIIQRLMQIRDARPQRYIVSLQDAIAAGFIGPSIRDLYDSTGKLKVTDDIPIFRGSLED